MIKPHQPNYSGGYFNVYKPKSWTSSDVVRKLKGLTGFRKIGHGGTLDPIATGILPICFGPATRLAQNTLLGTKEYVVEITLGTATDTYDSLGTITKQMNYDRINVHNIEEILNVFTGTFEQIPPMYSALRHNGARLYQLARNGIEVPRKPRKVKVYANDILSWNPPVLILHVECSHGFYARGLANDLGKKLGSVAHMSGLQRTRSGVFGMDTIKTLEEIQEAITDNLWEDIVLPLDFTLGHMSKIYLNSTSQKLIQHGQPLPILLSNVIKDHCTDGEKIRAYSENNDLIAILKFDAKIQGWQPDKVLLPL